MIRFTRETIRLEIDVLKQEDALDQVTGQSPSMWRGTDLALQIGVFAGATLVDVSAYSSITAEVRDAETRTSVVLATKTLGALEFNPALTSDGWTSGTDQHVTFTWTSEQTHWDLHGQKSRKFWLVVSAITTDSPPRKVTLGTTTITVVEDGAGEPANSPVPGDPTFLTAEQTAALIGQVVRPGNNPNGMTILLKSPNGQWGRIIGVRDDGSPQDDFVQLT